MPRRRAWCETLPLDALREPTLLRTVARYGLELLAAVRPGDLAEVAPLLGAASDAGVRVGLWPMLDDRDGRWASAHNAARFAAFARAALDAARGAPAPAELAVDLEPPFGLAASLVSRRPRDVPRPALRAPLAPARRALGELVDDAASRGVAVSAAVMPMVVYDAGARGAWQRWLATPVDGLPWSRVSVMAYTSLFEGWSLGAVRRDDAVALFADCCRRARARFGGAASVSLGAVGTGAFGDEPVYRSPGELRDDVTVAVACGVDDLALFDLAGALRRPPLEAWLAAFTEPHPGAAPRPTARSRALAAAASAFGRLPW